MVAGIHVLSTSLKNAMNSGRSRLSGSALDLATALSVGLGPAFDPLVALFMPILFGLCARTNKVFARRARACIFAVIENTRLSSILPYLTESVHSKSISLRLAALEGILTCFDPLDDTCASLLEEAIKLTARDVSVDVRRADEKIVQACNGMERFVRDTSPHDDISHSHAPFDQFQTCHQEVLSHARRGCFTVDIASTLSPLPNDRKNKAHWVLHW
jgi:hypothetical protein